MALLIVIFFWISDLRATKARVLSYFHNPEVEDTHVPEKPKTPDCLSVGSEEASSPLSL
jgi:hypothetical protein